MADKIFNSMELDAIGEVMNISLGSSATAVSNLLDHRVEITTPKVTVCDVESFTLGNIQPAVGVEIGYVSGLEGSNIMLLKRSDVKVIVDILMGSETSEEEFELNELTISAVCEVMNQMMGAASTALSDFLGYPVNISTPQSFELDNFDEFKKSHFPVQDGKCVVVHFALNIENALQSEFINVMSIDLTRKLLSGLGLEQGEDASPAESAEEPGGDRTLSDEEIQKLMGGGGDDQPASPPAPEPSGGKLTQEEIERLMSGGGDAQPAPPPAPEPSGGKLTQEEIERLINGGGDTQPAPPPAPEPSGGKLTQEEIERLMSGGAAQPAPQPIPQQPVPGAYPQPYPQSSVPPVPGAYPPPYPQGYYPPPGYYPMPPATVPDPKVINTQMAELQRLANGETLPQQQAENLDLLMSVPLEVSVEIGRAYKKVQDILAFSKGSLVILNKLAGDQVDLFVNGQCIAKGDVVVVDDNFGIRITEVLKSPDPNELVKS